MILNKYDPIIDQNGNSEHGIRETVDIAMSGKQGDVSTATWIYSNVRQKDGVEKKIKNIWLRENGFSYYKSTGRGAKKKTPQNLTVEQMEHDQNIDKLWAKNVWSLKKDIKSSELQCIKCGIYEFTVKSVFVCFCLIIFAFYYDT